MSKNLDAQMALRPQHNLIYRYLPSGDRGYPLRGDVMLRFILSPIVMLSLLTPTAQANDSQDWLEAFSTIDRVEIKEVENNPALMDLYTDIDSLSYQNDCSGQSPGAGVLSSEGDLMPVLNEIVRIGQKVWKVVEENKPVVSLSLATAHALPRGLSCWTDLDSWQAPTAKTYAITYTNLLGMEVVHFQFRLAFTPGGGYQGMGQYLSNVSILPAQLDVVWAYSFDATVEVGQAVNLGSLQSPIAGLEISVNWNVRTVLKDSQSRASFFVQGNGQVQKL